MINPSSYRQKLRYTRCKRPCAHLAATHIFRSHYGFWEVVTIDIETSFDADWILVSVDHHRPSSIPATIAIDKNTFSGIVEQDPRPPEVILRLIAHRTLKRMPLPNGTDGRFVITPFNVSLVWPR